MDKKDTSEMLHYCCLCGRLTTVVWLVIAGEEDSYCEECTVKVGKESRVCHKEH